LKYFKIFTINAQEGTLWLPDTLFLTEVIDQQRFGYVRLIHGRG
jgi:hypothetical protein